ncbi:hypothetical protein D3C73_1272780 [compost metagenome]
MQLLQKCCRPSIFLFFLQEGNILFQERNGLVQLGPLDHQQNMQHQPFEGFIREKEPVLFLKYFQFVIYSSNLMGFKLFAHQLSCEFRAVNQLVQPGKGETFILFSPLNHKAYAGPDN